MLLSDTNGPSVVNVISLSFWRRIPGVSEHIQLDDSDPGIADRLLAMTGVFAIRRWFETFPIGRLLNSLGPVDPSRVFWRKVKRNARALHLLKSANSVIATDLATTKTAWLAVHRNWTNSGFYDHRTASVGISWQLPKADKDISY